jgi:hypothetical protein
MGAFNTVATKLLCPSCRKPAEVTVQFKYGNTAQLNYRLGDKLEWGGNDRGNPGKRHVVVDGIVSSDCPNCKSPREWLVYVHIENDRITKIENADGSYNFLDSDGYLVID